MMMVHANAVAAVDPERTAAKVAALTMLQGRGRAVGVAPDYAAAAAQRSPPCSTTRPGVDQGWSLSLLCILLSSSTTVTIS